MAVTLVPDTSVLVDGRISDILADEDKATSTVLVPHAALAELEAQANKGLETGFAGLDELARLQRMAHEEGLTVTFVGTRPSGDAIAQAEVGAIDAMIRACAVDNGATLVTSDRVQAHAAEAQGIDYQYLRPVVEDVPDLTGLDLWGFFTEETMSVHLKADCRPMAKKGRPGGLTYEPIGVKASTHQELRALIKQCIEFAKRDYHSFVEMERHGCTVLQMGPMRVTIAQPPFSEALEVTAVRPVFKATLADYDLPDEIRERLEGRSRGVFIAGPPGSGKSTFAAAVTEHLHGLQRVVKTMEQPRDLQVPREVTQYGALDKDMAWTGEVILLVRPDHVVYDEVRTTNDFRVFADMRLAGIGLFGVTHANRPIDAVQRLIGRVDLGMIPQIVDTVVFIDAGVIASILELRFTVKVPQGMVQEDLARPVVVVKDLGEQKDVYELYTYGEQIVVMPLDAVEGEERGPSGADSLAGRELTRTLRRYVRGPMEATLRGDRATVYVEDSEIPALIGKGGRTVQNLERKLGVHLDIKSMRDAPKGRDRPGGRRSDAHHDDRAERPPSGRTHGGTGGVQVRRTGANVFVLVGDAHAGSDVVVEVEGAIIGEGRASQQGKVRFKAGSPEGKALSRAVQAGLDVTVRRA